MPINVAVLEVDEQNTFEAEMGWVAESGIHI